MCPQIINTYTEAVRTVDPFKATGRPHGLWVAFARFYEDNGQLDDVRGDTLVFPPPGDTPPNPDYPSVSPQTLAVPSVPANPNCPQCPCRP